MLKKLFNKFSVKINFIIIYIYLFKHLNDIININLYYYYEKIYFQNYYYFF